MENLGINFWRDRNVLVTGATGLLGSWMVEELLRRKANVVCLIRDWVPRSKLMYSGLIDKVTVVRGALEDYNLLVRALNEYEIRTVFHLGAQTIVGTAARSPLSTFEANIRGTWNLLEACRQCSTLIEQIVVASSDKAYGDHTDLPYREDTPLQGRFPYDVSKSCTDLIAFSYYHTYHLPVSVTRCGNLFGGGDLNFNRLIPGTILSALKNEPPIIRSDGKFVRDYFYVLDAVYAYLQLAEMMTDKRFAGEAFNFGHEKPLSVLELVDTILKLMDKKTLEPVILNQASNEIREQYLDCCKAKKWMNWKPQYSLEAGLKETIQWYSEWSGIPLEGKSQ
ncbi:MAG: NAD-dependent epimerase/dehydratase family protein [Calditrichaeota bacterium]|nr:MAG: NAD-dependent epimerase/dehydratase family protein [Calditrichota bacterium]